MVPPRAKRIVRPSIGVLGDTNSARSDSQLALPTFNSPNWATSAASEGPVGSVTVKM